MSRCSALCRRRSTVPGDIYHRSCSPVTVCARWFRSLRRRLCADAGPRVLCGPCSKGSKRKKSPRARGAEAHSWVGLAPPVRRISCGECGACRWGRDCGRGGADDYDGERTGMSTKSDGSRLRCALCAVSGFVRQVSGRVREGTVGRKAPRRAAYHVPQPRPGSIGRRSPQEAILFEGRTACREAARDSPCDGLSTVYAELPPCAEAA
ncbi:hypothetical protein DFH08DRAFT_124229 [Mycena albidolilacea]|uniref:Uncharacterized protein n=1 Tax=Mycena albidolilacea TaxID=1033008 RepID=A0AAD7A523_9AGAR|nr:hypothetical protein DFH08DRAFT_124229 [Mycena albidolilacea]